MRRFAIITCEKCGADIPDGASVMLGGFGLCGIPENLLAALVRRGVRNLHIISNNMGIDGFGLGRMLEAGMIASFFGSYVGENKLLELQMIAGQIETYEALKLRADDGDRTTRKRLEAMKERLTERLEAGSVR